MTVTASGVGKSYVLVHGGWHGAWAFGRVAPLLVLEGHQVLAEDLPGHGLRAQSPRSYRHRPLDMGKFAAEPSPVSGLTLADYADQVEAAVRLLTQRLPGHQVIVVGHSMAGLVLHQVGEAILSSSAGSSTSRLG
jgi:pimeloyl-ACP methyl ester carboxylesterase